MAARSKSMVARAMWNAQEALHGKNAAALPVALLGVCSVLLLYKHMSSSTRGDDSIKTFLALILMQMLPLVLLEVKILTCADPIGLLCKFGSHVMLMHAAFLGLRVGGPFLDSSYHYGTFSVESTFLLLALVTLWKGLNFRFSLRSMLQHSNVFVLAVCSLLAAYVQSLASAMMMEKNGRRLLTDSHLENTLTSGSDYIEILSFVPAVWMVYKENKNVPRVTVESAETKRFALAFFSFLVLFYTHEDIVAAYNAWDIYPMAAAGHLVHFLLLLDFSFFILAHIFNPEKLLNIKELFSDCFYNGV